MDSIKRTLRFFLSAALLAILPGCMENIALIGRPSIADGVDELVGEVERVDVSSRRIHLRTDRGESRTVAFSSEAQVLDRGREYPVSRLRPGDLVAIDLRKDARGEPHADLIRLRGSVREGASKEPRDKLVESAPRIVSLAGTVDRVDSSSDTFELNDQGRKPVRVILSEYVRDSDRERFRTLRAGDRVRIEGTFTGTDRFELLSFLNEEY